VAKAISPDAPSRRTSTHTTGDTAADLQVLRDLDDALERWGNGLERDWRFPSRAAEEALVEAHQQVKTHYARFSAGFLTKHPQLQEDYAVSKLSDDLRGDAGGHFSSAVQELRKRLA